MTAPTTDAPRVDPNGDGTWCDEHGRWECSGNKHGGERCHNPRIRGLNRCKKHSGTDLTTAKARGAANLAARAFHVEPGQHDDPGDVLAGAYTLAWAKRALVSQQIAARMAEQDLQLDDPALDGLHRLEQHWLREAARHAAAYIGLGLDARRLRIVEQTAEQLVAVLRGVVADLGHDPNAPAVQTVVRRHLELIAGAA